ncbi:hypothetical protein RHGRI_017695 [Rhododendron griersonianum]|uniref:Uncharacterized protein n=3 Tax=Rhododendron griersonianum TaxID=479676 RepID=A0AAV6JYS4_9ERIC|nr:hypothetical protein RHGRI_017695 [Rhododendron griersonianum]
MAANTTEQQRSISLTKSTSACSLFITRLMIQSRTWVFLSILVYAILLSSSWNILRSVLSWYESTINPSSSSSGWWPAPALYAAVELGAVLGLLSMAAAVAVAVPVAVVTWITVMVLLTFCGKPRRAVEVEGRKLTAEISGFVGKILIKEGNAVAVVCAVFGYFALVRRSRGEVGDSHY